MHRSITRLREIGYSAQHRNIGAGELFTRDIRTVYTMTSKRPLIFSRRASPNDHHDQLGVPAHQSVNPARETLQMLDVFRAAALDVETNERTEVNEGNTKNG